MSERDDLKARAAQLKLELPGNISTANLKAAVEQAEAQAPKGTGEVKLAGDHATPAAPSEPSPTLIQAVALTRIEHNGEPFDEGDPIFLLRKEFVELEGLGAVTRE